MELSREQLARHAAEILGNPLFQQVFNKLDKQTLSAWRLAATIEERERLHIRQGVLQDLKQEMLEHIENMSLAEKQQKAPGQFSAILAKLKEVFN